MSVTTETVRISEAQPEKPGATSRMMELLELLDTIQGQADSIIGISLHAIGQARQISDKLSTVYRAL